MDESGTRSKSEGPLDPTRLSNGFPGLDGLQGRSEATQSVPCRQNPRIALSSQPSVQFGKGNSGASLLGAPKPEGVSGALDWSKDNFCSALHLPGLYCVQEAPAVRPHFRRHTISLYGEMNKNHVAAANRIWWTYCSIATTALWLNRNGIIFRAEWIPIQQRQQEIWQATMRQLRASALQDSKRPETKVQGLYLRQMLDSFEYIVILACGDVPKPTRRQPDSTIVMWLDKFQGSIN
ncbi:hypothetical protein V7S43_009606 [Phytophthora oleae]|uniref:PiggyBac transposable element-derived protein domain-containing protein n=1 Tax=Phytophthora oleae TaxID=2107226 RepID=A0ABD3FI44_9STRA